MWVYYLSGCLVSPGMSLKNTWATVTRCLVSRRQYFWTETCSCCLFQIFSLRSKFHQYVFCLHFLMCFRWTESLVFMWILATFTSAHKERNLYEYFLKHFYISKTYQGAICWNKIIYTNLFLEQGWKALHTHPQGWWSICF